MKERFFKAELLRHLTFYGLIITCAFFGDSIAMPKNIPDSASVASASRLPPPMVASVVIDGIEYAQMAGSLDSEFGQIGGFLAAYSASGERLWWMKVYENRRIENIEGDIQDEFFESMELQPDGTLLIVSEDGKRFVVDVKSRTSTPLPKIGSDLDDDGLYPDLSP